MTIRYVSAIFFYLSIALVYAIYLKIKKHKNATRNDNISK